MVTVPSHKLPSRLSQDGRGCDWGWSGSAANLIAEFLFGPLVFDVVDYAMGHQNTV
jgi:hypothetical protein